MGTQNTTRLKDKQQHGSHSSTHHNGFRRHRSQERLALLPRHRIRLRCCYHRHLLLLPRHGPITAFPSAYTSRPLRAFPAQQCFTPSLLSSWSAASAALHSSLLWAWSSISHSVELSHTLPGLTHATDGSCSGFVRTAHGNGYTNLDNDVVGGDGGVTILPSLRTACRLQKAAFAVAIIGCVFFFISIFLEFLLIKHRRKERAFGPSPNNGYTAGTPKRKFWQRKPKNRTYADKNADTLPTHATPADMRTSYATDTSAVGGEPPINKYGNAAAYGNAPVSNGYQTTTTTNAPAVAGNGVSHDGYVRTQQPYHQNATGTF